MKQQNFTRRDFRGLYLSQASLSPNLGEAICGQRSYLSLLLALLILMVCLTASIFPGILGATIGLELFLKGKTWVQALLTSMVIAGWLLTVLSQNQRKGLSVVVIGLLVAIALRGLLIRLGIAKPVPFFFVAMISMTLSIFAVWTISVAIFYLIQFSIASLDVLFKQPQKTTSLTIIAVIIGTTIGTLIAIPIEFEFMAVSTSKQIVGFIGGITFGLAIALSGWWLNRRQNIPWTHPDLLRSWALKVGSWRGTSFYNLDLSRVSFKGAKLANTDLRAQTLYRTCFQGATGLERARVDSQYLDLENLKIQKLLTYACSEDRNFRGFNLRGAYLQNADLRSFDFTDTNLTGADLKGADLRESALVRTQLAGVDFQDVDLRRNILIDANLTEANLRAADLRDCILVRAQVARADFSGADLTGICIEDWSVSSKTKFTGVRCEYIYRRYRDGQPTDRYPVDRNFEPGEFASLFQQPENELELVFKGEEFDYTALSLTFDKLQTDKPDLKLKLQGIEQRQDLWVVKVTSDDPANVESRIKEIQDAVYQGYEITTTRLENNPLIRRIISDVANIKKTQEEIGEEVNQLAKRIGSNFYFLGGTITNVTGAGEIKYTEASSQVRSLVTGSGHETQVVNTLLNQLRSSNVATTANEQTELIQFVILEEAQRDPQFKQFLLQQAQQILAALPESSIATAIRGAIAQLESN